MTNPVSSALFGPTTPAATAAPSTTASTPSSTASTSSASSTAAAATGGNQPLGQDAFLKLLMAQLSNQDPLNPTDSTQFVTQLAQFSLVEQSKQQSTQLSTISTQLQGLSNSDATSLVGKTVTVSGATMAWNGTAAPTTGVTLSTPAANVVATVTDASGNVVRTMQLGAEKAGPLTVTWDGHAGTGQAAPQGYYTVQVSATDANGLPVNVAQSVTDTVASVSFSQGYPQLVLSGGTTVPISELVGVGTPPAGTAGITTGSSTSTTTTTTTTTKPTD